ncbi:phosphotransferase [Enterococcus sp. LJL98]
MRPHKIEEYLGKAAFGFEIIDCQPLTGGTSSQVFLLTDAQQESYVFKSNDNIREEIDYLTQYSKISLFPRVLYCDLERSGYLYSFMPGQVEKKMLDKQKILTDFVIKVLNNYQVVEEGPWGWVNEPKKNWQDFLLTEMEVVKEVNRQILTPEDDRLIKEIGQKIMQNSSKPYLLHGDSGVHNFLQKEGELVGVIDPEPLIGPRIYDLICAFCSTPKDLTYEVIATAASNLAGEQWSRRNLVEEVLMGLYFRFPRCFYHHPIDLPAYLIAWKKWKKEYLEVRKVIDR